MSLHDAVGIHFKKGVTTENQEASVKYMGSGVYVRQFEDCACVFSDLT